MTRRINAAGLAILKHYEDCSLEAYLCPARRWTCGWGETEGVTKDTVWTQRYADERLEESLRKREAAVERLLKVPLTDNQFSALVSLVYNIGVTAFAGSTLLRKLNNADYAGAAEEIPRWNKAGAKILRGLTRRRIAERDLFDRAR
jgi:lysozyme